MFKTHFPQGTTMSHKQIYYSDKYDDDKYEYRYVRHAFTTCSYIKVY